MTRVVAPSRLHFGLLHLPGTGQDRWPGIDGGPGLPIRQFGGVGLMIDGPGVTVRVERANEWSSEGPLAVRAMEFASRFTATLPPDAQTPFRILVEQCASEHAGLGTGTQLALAVAKAIAVESGFGNWPATELARRAGRGGRSAIGVHGFDRGGLVVEGGKLPGEAISPLVCHHPFPSDWAVLLFSPGDSATWHGTREREAFTQLEQVEPSLTETDALCRLVLTGMLPALALADLDAFGEAVFELNARVGEGFASVQGGRYASPAVSECVSHLRGMGVKGVGQSSWGPTVFAVVPADRVAAVRQSMSGATAMETHRSSGARID
jgi:beta-RFAP synthase